MATCNEEGCQVKVTGKCVNGLELDECPHYQKDIDGEDALVPDEDSDDSSEESQKRSDIIEVFDGKAISLGDVNRISGRTISRLIILAGMPDAGKTTLLLSLLHLFATKPEFEGYLFAGSETLLDFESKSHPATIDSGNLKETTGRTPIGPPTFLHLRVSDTQDDGKITDLLFTDISGENFRALKDSTAECKKFTIGQRADHFALFFDTQRISSVKDRASAKVAGVAILRSLYEAGTLLPHTKIQIVFSRWDLRPTGEETAAVDLYIEQIKNEIKEKFDTVYEIQFFEVAARPNGDGLPFGFGIERVLPIWVNSSMLDKKEKPAKKEYQYSGKRQYLQFTNA